MRADLKTHNCTRIIFENLARRVLKDLRAFKAASSLLHPMYICMLEGVSGRRLIGFFIQVEGPLMHMSKSRVLMHNGMRQAILN